MDKDEKSISNAMNNIEKECIDFQKKIATEVLKGVIDKTPVLTGRCRGNWRVSINKPDHYCDPATFDKESNRTFIHGKSVIDSVQKIGQKIYICNSVYDNTKNNLSDDSNSGYERRKQKKHFVLDRTEKSKSFKDRFYYIDMLENRAWSAKAPLGMARPVIEAIKQKYSKNGDIPITSTTRIFRYNS